MLKAMKKLPKRESEIAIYLPIIIIYEDDSIIFFMIINIFLFKFLFFFSELISIN